MTTFFAVLSIFGIGVFVAPALGRFFHVQETAGPYQNIDGMRAVAALLVVCSHAAPVARTLYGETPSTPFIEAMGAIGVQVFFGITAFLFSRKALQGSVDVPSLIASRVRRIVPLYFVCSAVAVAFALYLSTTLTTAPPVEYKDVIKTFAFGFVGGSPIIAGVATSQLIGQAWTLAWEWMFYLTVPFLAAIFARRSWTMAALIFTAACALYQLKEGQQIWVFFVPGVLAAMLEKRIALGRFARVAVFALGMIAYGISLALEAKLYGPARLILSTMAFPCVLFGHQWLMTLRPLRLLGEVSYSLYMLQLLVLTGYWRIATDEYREFFPTLESKVALGLAATATFFMLAFCAYAAIERPFMRRQSQSGNVALAPSSTLIERAQ